MRMHITGTYLLYSRTVTSGFAGQGTPVWLEQCRLEVVYSAKQQAISEEGRRKSRSAILASALNIKADDNFDDKNIGAARKGHITYRSGGGLFFAEYHS